MHQFEVVFEVISMGSDYMYVKNVILRFAFLGNSRLRSIFCVLLPKDLPCFFYFVYLFLNYL